MRIRLGMGVVLLALGAGCSLNTMGLGSGGADPSDTTGSDSEPGDASKGSSTGLDTTASEGEEASSGEPTCDEPTLWYPDDDGDGHGDLARPVPACEQPEGHVAEAEADDCNDEAATAFPGADEICDGLDNDCDELIDEWTEGTNDAACNGCVPHKEESVLYYACAGDMLWSEAELLCQARGAELTSIADMAENDVIQALLEGVGGYDHAWIGYNDLELEGVWVWSDDSPTGFERWAVGQPADPGVGGDTQDCVTMAVSLGEWFDRPCDNSGSDPTKSDGVVCRVLIDEG